MVDIHGKIYEPKTIVDSFAKGTDSNNLDVQWLKKNIAIQTLPNGICTLPFIQGKCPHANSCFTCCHFRTDDRYLPEHKKQLEVTNKVIEVAKKNGWKRQIEMNERLRDNLIAIIKPLEDTHGA
jgi:hypothetical protein